MLPLKYQPRPKLDIARRLRSGDAAEGAVARCHVGIVEIRVIQQIEGVGLEAKVPALADLEYFAQGDIPDLPARTLDDADSGVSQRRRRRICKGCRVEPFVDATLAGRQRHRAAQILRSARARNR